MDYNSLYVKNFKDHYDEDDLKRLFAPFGEITSVRVMKDEYNDSRGFGFVNFKTHYQAKKAERQLKGHKVEGTALKLFVGPPKQDSNQKNKLRIERVNRRSPYRKHKHKSFRSRSPTPARSTGYFDHDVDENFRPMSFSGHSLKPRFSSSGLDSNLTTNLKSVSKLNQVTLFVNKLNPYITDSELEELFAEKYNSVVEGKAKVSRDGERSKGFGFVLFNSYSEAMEAISEMNGMRVGDRCIEVSVKREKKNSESGTALKVFVGPPKQDSNHKNKLRIERVNRRSPYRKHKHKSFRSRSPTPVRSSRYSDHDVDENFRPMSFSGHSLKPRFSSSGLDSNLTTNLKSVSKLNQVTLFVNKLNPYITDSELEELFAEKYNSVVEGKAKVSRDGKRSKGFGFVLFNSYSEAMEAISEMNGMRVGDRCIEVSVKREKKNSESETKPMNFQTEKNVIVKVKMTPLIAKYIKKYCMNDKCCINYVESQITENPSGIEIKGKKNNVQKASDWLEHQLLSADEHCHTIKEIGIPKYFQSERGMQFLKETEKKFKCVIEIKVIDKDIFDAETDMQVYLDSNLLFKNKTKCGYLIGDISEESSDVIVTTTSPSNFHTGDGSEISKQLLKKAGLNLANECKARAMGKTPKHGDVVATTGYNLKCKEIYHIAIKDYMRGESVTDLLKSSIKTCLKMADSSGYLSISFPCIGTGGFGYPVNKVLKLINKIVSKGLFVSLENVWIVVFQKNMECMQHLKKIKDLEANKSQDDMGSSDLNIRKALTSHSKKKQYDDEIQFDICLNLNKKFEVIQHIKDHVNEKTAFQSIKDELISDLSDHEERTIMNWENRNDVKIEKVASRFEVQGLSDNVLKTVTEINEILNAVRSVRKWVWKIKSSVGEMKPFSKNDNFTLEAAYQKYMENAFSFDVAVEYNGSKIIVNVDTLRAQGFGIRFRVFRILKSDENLPTHWERINENFFKVEVAAKTQEFNDVILKFRTAGLSLNKTLKLERIQNKTLYQQFEVQKKTVVARIKNPVQELFHGTTANVCDSIIKNGFDRSHAGKNATAYGHGVYFAKKASYSDRYAGAGLQATKKMFLADVITGEYTVGNSFCKVIPNTPAGHPYDSLVDSAYSPTIFVVFKDASVYPKYLLTYQ